ncbi:hypothetical protein, partial [Klebsiella pneumoniae]|uniref:hypothetical protein n=1 Tax=Klebsiella pneumoniae TaxID=573 RepID=UPI00272FC82B
MIDLSQIAYSLPPLSPSAAITNGAANGTAIDAADGIYVVMDFFTLSYSTLNQSPRMQIADDSWRYWIS